MEIESMRKSGVMKKQFILLAVLIILAYAGGFRLYKTENGLVFGIPDYEKKASTYRTNY